MAKIIIYAHVATFSVSGGGFSCMSYMPFDDPIYREEFDLKNVAEINAKRAEVYAQLEAADPGRGFFVAAMLVRGQRAPNGFKALRRFEYDPATREQRDAQLAQLVDKAVEELVAAGKIDPARAKRAEVAELGALAEAGAVGFDTTSQLFKKVDMGGGCTAFVL